MVHSGANPARKYVGRSFRARCWPAGAPRDQDLRGSRSTPGLTRQAFERREHAIDAHPPGIISLDQARAPALAQARSGQIGECRRRPESCDAVGSVAPVELGAGKQDAFGIHGRHHPAGRTRGSRVLWEAPKMPEAGPAIADHVAPPFYPLNLSERGANGLDIQLPGRSIALDAKNYTAQRWLKD